MPRKLDPTKVNEDGRICTTCNVFKRFDSDAFSTNGEWKTGPYAGSVRYTAKCKQCINAKRKEIETAAGKRKPRSQPAARSTPLEPSGLFPGVVYNQASSSSGVPSSEPVDIPSATSEKKIPSFQPRKRSHGPDLTSPNNPFPHL